MFVKILNILLLLNINVYGQNEVLIKTNVGQIVGYRGAYYTKFLGVPYGSVDNTNPFSAATAHPYFETPYYAKDIPPVCLQTNSSGIIEGEIQCLKLNIYIPNKVNNKLPVMAYIPGGIFVFGECNIGTCNPNFIMKHDVIFVTIHHRLGPYGFICLPNIGYSNQGLYDIIFALKWIQDNIRSFGGDDQNILLIGHSSGSVLADLILQYNKNNVFNKVILQSGQAVKPVLNDDVDTDLYLKMMATKLNINKDLNSADILQKLITMDVNVVMNATGDAIFRPCIDNVFNNKPREENFNKMKILIGMTDRDMLYIYDQYRQKGLTNLERIKEDLNRSFYQLPAAAVETVTTFYNYTDDIIVFGTDLNYKYPIDRSLKLYMQNNGTDIYRYVFSHDGERNYCKERYSIKAKGAIHCDELGYLFDIDILMKGNITDRDQRVINITTTYWTNFAKYGNPSPRSLWPKLKQDLNVYMNITTTPTLVDMTHDKAVKFWDSFYQMYGDRVRGWRL